MNNADDFTFCKVEREVDDDHHHQLGSPKRMPDIGNVTLEDNNLKGTRTVPADVSQSSASDPTQALKPSGSSPSSHDKNAKAIKNSAPDETGIATPIVEGSAQIAPLKKSSARAKVPFEKGYSQMDWLKLTRTHPDLAGLNGRSNRRLISMDEVKQHKSDGSIWTVLKGHVYNISPYMKFHPGGVDLLMKAAGKDCTSLFNKYHAWVNAEFLLEKCLVGMLDTN